MPLKAVVINPKKAMNVIHECSIIIEQARRWCAHIENLIEEGNLEEAMERLKTMRQGMGQSFAEASIRNAYAEEELPDRERFALEQARANAEVLGTVPQGSFRTYTEHELDDLAKKGYRH